MKSVIHKENNNLMYFLTFTVKNWYYLFDRNNRFEMLANTLKFFQENKGLKIYAYVFMLNHIHLIIQSDNVINFVRDFKRWTSRELKNDLIKYEPEVLKLFLDKDNNYNFWQDTNKPEIIENEKFFIQKLNYILNNPVKKDYVEKPEYWKWSSANENNCIKIENI